MKKLITFCLISALLPVSKGEESFALKCNDFALKFYKSVIGSHSNENFVFSPVSIYSACSLLSAASAGDAASEMDGLLGLDGSREEHIAQLGRFSGHLAEIGAKKNCLFKSWNFVWLSDRLQYNGDFLGAAKGIPNLFCESVDFASPSAPADMRGAVLGRTSNLLAKFPFKIDPLAGGAFAVQNYSIFDGLWLTPFDPSRTSERGFFYGVGQSVRCMMMDSDRDGHKYYDEIKFEAVRMPYRGGRMSMVVLVPKGARSFKTALSHVDAAHMEKVLSALSDDSAELASVVMPRFRLNQVSFSAKPALEALGVRKIFETGADFSYLSKGLSNAGLGDFTHNAAIVVNEKGTKAEALSETTAGFLTPKNRLLANRPFIFFIVHNKTGLICFMGHIFNPAQN